MRSRSMYRQTSSSVQFERGKTRTCSPGACRPLYRSHSSGRWRRGVPRAEGVAEAEHALLGPGLLLVAPAAAEDRVEPVGLDRVEQRNGLQRVACAVGALSQPTVVDVVLHPGHDQPDAQALDGGVAVLEHLREVVTGVDVQQGERQWRRCEGLERQVHHHHGVLAAREQDHGPLELARHLAEDVDGLGLEVVEVVEGVLGWQRLLGGAAGGQRRRAHVCSPHSVLFFPAQRPALGSSPGATALVQGAQPIEANPLCRNGFRKTSFSST